jgi:hypothetical protein
MAELKTTRNDGDVDEFLNSVEDETRRRDSLVMRDLMSEITGEKPEMWGSSIVGFGTYAYRARSGGGDREWFKTGFSPRKQSLTLYIMDGFSDYDELLSELGPHSTGKACLYVRDLTKVDRDILTRLIHESVAHVETRTSY